MAELELTKHHGLGNDFLVAFHPHVDDLPALARRLCDRRRGIGADGLLIGESEAGYAARMVLYNSDGSRAEMSGNGIRCFAQALAARRGDLDAATHPDRRRRAIGHAVSDGEPDVIEAAVDMGEVAIIEAPGDWHRVGTDPLRPVSHLSVGNPHAVVAVDDVTDRRSAQPGNDRARHQPGDRRGRSRAARHHDARPRTRCRHHGGVRHRGLRQRVGGPCRGASSVPSSKKSPCTWMVEMPRYVCTNLTTGTSPWSVRAVSSVQSRFISKAGAARELCRRHTTKHSAQR